ncbi:MAG: MobF family relaxase, partial [Pseudomonadota bacterium]
RASNARWCAARPDRYRSRSRRCGALMFNIVQVKGDDAGGYYGTQANYYLGGQAPSRWVGKGAEEIGYVGEIDPEKFTQLMNGEVSRDGEAPQKVLSGVRKGWDMTISAPKWASVLITLGGDKRLSTHWQNAAQKAFDYVERFATYRQTTRGRTQEVVGAKLIGGAFLHDANRNNEPSIHVHMVASAIGVTKDGKLRAVDLQHAYKHAKLIG